ncbi:MAG: malic enzyme-like NAD(P)-binding protein [Halobacteria archaeon]|nr:malic enzyme-like NAD(P)-binding protein [Halobacteria archaeon]
MSIRERALELHRKRQGKISVESKVPVENGDDLSLAYSPGVAAPCEKIDENPDSVYDYTIKGNTVAIVSDGSAVLGLGDIGADAALPVMEGKVVLFKEFAGIDAFPVCLRTESVDEIVETVERLEPVFGGVNLEDIGAPECFEVENRLRSSMQIPIFHDDQHGTAIITLAGILNSADLIDKDVEEMTVSISGAGASATAIAHILLDAGVKDVFMTDSTGVIHRSRRDLNEEKRKLAGLTNDEGRTGDLEDAMRDTDVFIGLSVGGIVDKEMVEEMADDPIVFAMANPIPEIWPEDAREAGARIIGTGRSDYPNQVNNVLGFPGIFRGALEVRASDINEQMKVAAAEAIAEIAREEVPEDVQDRYPDEDLEEGFNEEYVIPKPFDSRVVPRVASAVAQAAIDTDVARLKRDPDEIEDKVRQKISEMESSQTATSAD